MTCRIYKLDFQEKNLNLDQARDLEIRGSNPGPGSNFSLENLTYFFTRGRVMGDKSIGL